MDYVGLNSGISRGMLTGMQIMRAKQQDDRQTTLDAENRQVREEERGMRTVDRAYQEEERTYAKEKRSKTETLEKGQARLNALNYLQRDQYGQPKPLDANALTAMTRMIEEDEDLRNEFVGENKDVTGFAGFREGEGKYQGKLVPMLKMREDYGYGNKEDGNFVPTPYAPLTKTRTRDGELYVLTPEELADNLTNFYIGQGAKYDYPTKEKPIERKTFGGTEEGWHTLDPDGKPVELVKPMGFRPAARGMYDGGGTSGPATGMSNTLAQQVIDGRLDPAMISKRDGLQQRVFAKVEELSPGFNLVGANANAKYLTNTGNLQSRALVQGVTPLYDKLLAAGAQLGNSRIPGVNKVANWLKEQTGDPDIVAFNNLRDDMIAETERVLLGSGVLSDSKYQRALHNVNSSQSYPQLQAAVNQLKIVVGSRLDALDAQPVQTTAPNRQAEAGNAPAPQGKTVTRNGRAADGRTVIQYNDGSWEYGR